MTSKQINLTDSTPSSEYITSLLSALSRAQFDPTLMTVSFSVDDYMDFNKYPSFAEWPDHQFPAVSMLKAILISFSDNGYSSLRKMEKMFNYDIRIRLLFERNALSYVTIHSFLERCLKPHMEELFTDFNGFAQEFDPFLNASVLFLDGTKLEANANRMTFVWSTATSKFMVNAWEKLCRLIRELNDWLTDHGSSHFVTVLKKPDPDFLYYLDSLFVVLENEYDVQIVTGRGHRKHPLQRFHDQFAEIAVRLFRYAIYEELADGRNSFSKTDPDATFMHMKYDYYNHTNVFKPGYNIQLGTSSGYIRTVHVSQNCNDMHDFIPTIETYKNQYGEYPEMVPADAEYGSYDNYSCCEEHGIRLMMKYSGQRQEQEKITDKNRYRSWAFEKADDGAPVCPAGHKMDLLRTKLSCDGIYPKEVSYYGCCFCKECSHRSKCTKSKYGRKIQICHELERMKLAVRENMSSEEGHDIMVSRSIQAEGTFGEIKENYKYDRL